MTTSSYTRRRPCNHGLHLTMTVLTLGLWGLFVWPVAALMGRKETVTYQVPPVHTNAVNPYNGHAYYDPAKPPLQYPPGHPVHYGR